MDAVIAVALVVAVWGLLWAGAVWVGKDTRDGRDWSPGRSLTGRQGRSFD